LTGVASRCRTGSIGVRRLVVARFPVNIRALLPAAALALLLFVHAGPAGAGGFTVNTTTDAVDTNPGDSICATAATNCSLRAAIQESNALAGADSISVPAGTFGLSVADLDGSVDLDVTSSITLNGAGAGTSIVDAGDLGRAFDILTTELVSLGNLTVQNGNAGSADGGGIRNSGADLHLSNIALQGNDAPSATMGGGGLFTTGGSVTIADGTISGNTAGGAVAGGGGIAANGGLVTLTNVTISGNSAPKGGAVYTTNLAALTANNVTISANTSTNGIALSEGGSVTFRNTIIGTNSGTNCVAVPTGAFFTAGHNLSSDGSCPSTGGGDLPNTDPMLGPLGDNGGTTMTHALPALSPAIDAGDDLGCADTDQRGIDRPQGAHCDIGAFELEVPVVQGDIDCSGDVNSADALKVLRFNAGLTIDQTEPCPNPPSVVKGHPFGDVDCSGGVSAADALKILRFKASLTVSQAEPCADLGTQL
jgi:CSLREA domain-containing protein